LVPPDYHFEIYTPSTWHLQIVERYSTASSPKEIVGRRKKAQSMAKKRER
jgi:hypothetical protein